MGLIKDLAGKDGEIADYLRNHPDFFIKHPEILPELKIPHETDVNVASLIEYQVAHLRQQSAELQNTMHHMEHIANVQRKFSEHVHTLSLQLLAADDPEELYNTLHKGLKSYYSADRILLLIFKKAEGLKNYSGLRFFKSDSKLRFMFTEIFHQSKPLCGSLQEEHLLALFHKDAEIIKSTALLPFQQSDWNGLLVLGSRERNQYSHGFELDLLGYIATICSLVIDSWF